MAILSMLLSVPEPSGFWITIIRAFENVTNNYVLAIIFLTVVIKLIWTPIDMFNRRSQQKMTAVQAQMQPELEVINKKYAKDPNLLKQKQNEVYKKYNSKSMGGCFLMLLFMALNLTIFFTLFSGLNTMGAYKISESYDYLKYSYANVLEVTNVYLNENSNDVSIFENPENISFVVDEKTNEIILLNGETELARSEYKTDFSYKTTEEVDGKEQEVTKSTNDYLNNLLSNFDAIVLKETPIEGSEETSKYTLKNAVTDSSAQFIVSRYQSNKENFLWIDNIWIADSPFNQSIVNYNGYASQIGSGNVEAGEETIYNAFIPKLQQTQSRVNGYFILPILCILTSVLSILLSSKLGKKKNETATKQNKWMMIIMPLIFGIFALFYNSVFAIYMLISQVMSAITLPLQNLVLKAIDNRKKKKEEETKVEVDYTRKF